MYLASAAEYAPESAEESGQKYRGRNTAGTGKTIAGTTKPRSSGPGLAVGMTGFEPATSSSRTTRATKLRHIPMLTYQRIP